MITKTDHAFLDFKHVIKYDTIFQHSTKEEFLKIQKLYSEIHKQRVLSEALNKSKSEGKNQS